MEKTKRKAQTVTQPAGPVYILGGLGALIYYIGIAHGFWPVVLAFLKAIVWPAFLTHDLLKFIA